MSGNVQCAVNHPDGWAVKARDARRVSSVHDTQAEAIMVARWTVIRNGGGEVLIQGQNGRWQERETLPCRDDPFPPRGAGWWRAFWRSICRIMSDTW